VFVVAQRISTVINADRIVVLDDGRVVGIGTHSELVKTNEVYREIVASQVSLDEVA
jgi:ATP-binding cassette subfamily B protein